MAGLAIRSTPGDGSFDLTRLLDPLTPAQFFAEHWEEKPLLLNRNRAEHYAGLLSLEEIDPLVTVLPPDTVTVTNADQPLAVADFARADGSLDVIKACRLFAEGATLIIEAVQKRLARVAACCRALEQAFGASSHCNLYLTPPHGKGFDTHYDTHDVLVLQIAGSKEWTVFDSPVRLPLNGQPFDPALHAAGPPTLSGVLQAGDLLYIPRGFLHGARCRDEVSLHATLGIKPQRWADVMMETMAQLCLSDPAFRRALPVGLGGADFDAAAARPTFEALLSRVASQANPQAALERFADNFAVERRAFVPGQLLQARLALELSPDDEVGVRPHAIFRLQADGDRLRLRAHGRETVLPADSATAVRFALTTARYRICDLPGEFDDEDKVSLVKCLIDEGLVMKLAAR